MLKFIFGRAASGKTETIFRRIKAETDKGNQNQILIVPEQSSFDCERKLLHILGDGKYTVVPVLSFTRLFDEISRLSGGLSQRRLNDSERIIFLSRAILAAREQLSFFSKYAEDMRFIENVVATLDEFKRCGIGGAELRQWSERIDGSLSRKLSDLAVINDFYEAIIGSKYSDPSDELALLERRLGEYAYFAEKTVYIDSFKNFTGAQMGIIERIISQADDVVFSFCYDEALSEEGELFSNVAKTVKSIIELAKKHGVEVAKPEILGENYYNSQALAALERGLSINIDEKYEEPTENVCIISAPDKYGEAELCAAEIRRLVREKGYRYRDFLIVARHAEQYANAVEDMCRRYELPCHVDSRYEISYLPASVYLLSALRAADNFSTEDILKYLKTELAGFSETETAMLENYVYIWKVSGSKWREEWTMSPSGLDKFDDEDKALLEDINALRIRAIEPLFSLRAAFNKTARELCAAAWALIETQKVAERLAALCEQLPAIEAEQNRLGFSALAEILDSLVIALGDDAIAPKKFIEFFSLALSASSVGAIPQKLDEISFGSADRIMPREPKIIFMLGMNQGVFPATVTPSGIIAGSERISLLRAGMPILDYTLGFSVDEEYLAYKNACAATDMVYFSYFTGGGEETKPSGIIDRVEKILPKSRKLCRDKIEDNALIETAASGFTVLMRNRETAPKGMEEYFASREDYKDLLAAIDNVKNVGEEALNGEIATKLFGKNMYLSATGVDTYFRCAFSYFCSYGMKLKVIKPAEIDSLQRGTIVHEALEKIVSANGKDIIKLSDEEIIAEIDKITEDYLSRIPGIEQVADNRFMYAISAIKQLSADVICHIRDDFAQNEFEPVKCELKISGQNSYIDGATIQNDGGSIKLNGSIDRVDKFGAYIRVVDYKTGSRRFRLPDVLYGLNMQMLLYLYAVIKSDKFANSIPAGVLYLETRKAPDAKDNFSMNGLIAQDSVIHAAMDAENSGRFVPKLKVKKDGAFYKSNDFIEPEHFYDIFDHMEKLIKGMNRDLRAGKISVNPTDGLDKDACKYCDFASVCGIENKPHRKVEKCDNEKILEKLKGGDMNV